LTSSLWSYIGRGKILMQPWSITNCKSFKYIQRLQISYRGCEWIASLMNLDISVPLLIRINFLTKAEFLPKINR
jgi:hypothetical protein